MPKRDLSIPRRQSKKRNPEQLYNTLCGMYPQYMAEEYFKKLMGYAPPQEWRKPETHAAYLFGGGKTWND